MSDTQVDNKKPPKIRSRPILPSLTGSTQNYTTVAVDEIELANDFGTPADQRDVPKPSRWSRTPNEVISQSAWIHRNFWLDTWSDVKEVPLVWLGRRFLSHILPFSVIACLLSLLVIMARQLGPFSLDDGTVCSPDGMFQLSYNGYDPWNRNATFTIDVSFGSFSFGIAKLIDVCWDVGVARGGQAILAFYSYLAFTKALSRMMETSAVSQGTFSAITLQQNTLTSLLIMIRDFSRTGGRRAKVAMAWIIFAASFVLFSPTWISAMTGYAAEISPYVQDDQQTLVPVEMFQPVVYIIADASRFNNSFEDNHLVTVPWGNQQPPYLYPGYGCNSVYEDATTSPGDGRIDFAPGAESSGVKDLDCKWMWAVSKYAYNWGFMATSTKRNTTFDLPDESNLTTTIVFDPPLNIKAYPTNYGYYDLSGNGWWYYPYGPTWQDPSNKQHPYNQSNPAFYYNTSRTLYTLNELNENGSCLQEGSVTYQWGFSYALLFIFTATFLIWCIGTWALYLDSWLHSALDQTNRQMGPERAVLDIARSMENKLNMDQIELRSNSQINSLIKGNKITYSDLPLQVTRWTEFKIWWLEFRFREWAKDEKWWLVVFGIFLLMWILSLSTGLGIGWVPAVSALPWLAVLAVLAAGRDTRSRWLLFAVIFLIFWIFNFWWISDYNACGGWCTSLYAY